MFWVARGGRVGEVGGVESVFKRPAAVITPRSFALGKKRFAQICKYIQFHFSLGKLSCDNFIF